MTRSCRPKVFSAALALFAWALFPPPPVLQAGDESVTLMKTALALVDPAYPGMPTATGREDRPGAAMEALLQYYRERPMGYHFDPESPLRDLENIENETHDTTTLDAAVARRFTFEQETVAFTDGIDWRKTIYDREWAYMFHRHTHFRTLVEGFRRYGDERYMEAFVYQLREWDRQVEADHPRTLETGLRLQHWIRLFPVAVHSEQFTPEVLALFLVNLHGMADALNSRGIDGYRRGNWGAMEAQGTLQAGTYFPELREAAAWRDDARTVLFRHFEAATYPDGVYRGRSPHYHNVILREFHTFERILRLDETPIPADFQAHGNRMLDFAAAYTRPDHSIPQFGDSDNDPMGERLATWGEDLNRPDLLFLATHGERGTPPAWRDRVFREGGFGLLRSPWEDGTDARWLMFDFGPRGRGGFRSLSVDLAAYGRPLAVMPGRYRYHDEEGFRALFVSTPFQNTVSIDGQNQVANPDTDLSREKLDGALKVLHAWHDGYRSIAGEDEGPVIHERQVAMIRDTFWIVADYVRGTGDRKMEFAQNWHFMPGDLVAIDGAPGYRTGYSGPNLALIPLAGAGEPRVKDGWYSPRYGVKHPAPWLAFTEKTAGPWFHATLLAPFRGVDMPPVAVEAARQGNSLSVSVRWEDGYTDHVHLGFGPEKGSGKTRWTGTGPDGVSASETLD